jgi:hypothetical protein
MNPNDANTPDEGNVMPSVTDDTPLPGQPEPTPEPTGDPTSDAPDGNEDADKTVPLAALHEERQKRQELQAELEVLRQLAGDSVLFDINGKPVQAHPGQRQPQQQQQPDQPQTQAAQELEKLWETDPRKAVQVEIMAAMSWRDNMEVQVDNQILAASQKYSDYKEYDNTVRQYIRALPLEQRSRPGVVDLAYFVVKGQNSTNAVERAKAEMLKKYQTGQQAQGLGPGTMAAQPKPKTPQLSEEQKKVAEAMGLTEEQYMSAMVVKK